MIGEPSWETVLTDFGSKIESGIHTSMPGIVRAYDAATQTVEVQVALRVAGKALPVLQDVPVAFPAGGGFGVTFPLVAGDGVELVFEEFDSANYRDTGTLSDPNTLRKFGLSAWAVPVRRPTAPLPVEAGALVISKGATRVVLDSASVHLGASTGDVPVALATQLTAYLSALETALTAVTGAVLAPGGGPAVQAAWAAFTATAAVLRAPIPATKVKAI